MLYIFMLPTICELAIVTDWVFIWNKKRIAYEMLAAGIAGDVLIHNRE